MNGLGDFLLGVEVGMGGLFIVWGLGGGLEGWFKKLLFEYGLNRFE